MRRRERPEEDGGWKISAAGHVEDASRVIPGFLAEQPDDGGGELVSGTEATQRQTRSEPLRTVGLPSAVA